MRVTSGSLSGAKNWVVFTLPHELSWLALNNKKIVYDLLFRASAATLLEVAVDPKHLGAEIGFLSVLHTWGQNLQYHPHIHCVIPSGGLSLDHQRWIHPRYTFFLPVKALSRVFRGKFIAGLKRAFRRGELAFPGSLKALAAEKAFAAFLRPLFRQDAVVYAKRPFGGPEHVLHYLARYTHRVAISNHRLVSIADGMVTFRWKDYAHGNKQRKMTLTAEEFLRRFMLHVLPRGFVRIRFFGFLANRRRKQLRPLCQRLLNCTPKESPQAAENTEIKPTWLCPQSKRGYRRPLQKESKSGLWPGFPPALADFRFGIFGHLSTATISAAASVKVMFAAPEWAHLLPNVGSRRM